MLFFKGNLEMFYSNVSMKNQVEIKSKLISISFNMFFFLFLWTLSSIIQESGSAVREENIFAEDCQQGVKNIILYG